MLPVLALVVAAAALTVAAILSVTAVHERDRLDALYNQESQHTLDNAYQAQRITFCYDNNIHPCVLDKIMAWNKAHPDNTLQLSATTLPK